MIDKDRKQEILRQINKALEFQFETYSWADMISDIPDLTAEEHLNKWVNEIGWDNTLDLIKRNKDQACYRIYKELLEKRGFKIR